MPTLKGLIKRPLPAPVMAAVMAIIATRLFNLLMVVLHPDGDSSADLLFQLSSLPGYLMIFSLVIMVFLFETGCALMLLRGSFLSRRLFMGCQCLLVLFVLPSLWIGWGAGLLGIDMQDTQQLSCHILLQKLPDILILLMLYLPVSSRKFFSPLQKAL